MFTRTYTSQQEAIEAFNQISGPSDWAQSFAQVCKGNVSIQVAAIIAAAGVVESDKKEFEESQFGQVWPDRILPDRMDVDYLEIGSGVTRAFIKTEWPSEANQHKTTYVVGAYAAIAISSVWTELAANNRVLSSRLQAWVDEQASVLVVDQGEFPIAQVDGQWEFAK